MESQPSITKTEQAIRLRITALYHNCMSSAAFKREDALKTDDENETITLRREAMAYEPCAGWLLHVKE